MRGWDGLIRAEAALLSQGEEFTYGQSVGHIEDDRCWRFNKTVAAVTGDEYVVVDIPAENSKTGEHLKNEFPRNEMFGIQLLGMLVSLATAEEAYVLGELPKLKSGSESLEEVIQRLRKTIRVPAN